MLAQLRPAMVAQALRLPVWSRSLQACPMLAQAFRPALLQAKARVRFTRTTRHGGLKAARRSNSQREARSSQPRGGEAGARLMKTAETFCDELVYSMITFHATRRSSARSTHGASYGL